MSIDKTLSPIKAVSFEEYHKIVLGLIREDLRTYVTESMTKGIYDDPTRQEYPIRTTVNDLTSQAAQLLRAAQSKEFTGWLLPGCDIPDIRGGGTNIRGWRPNMVVSAIDGVKLDRVKVMGFTNWGHHSTLWRDKDLSRKDQQKVLIPFYRPVTIIGAERAFKTKDYGEKKGWDLLYLKEVHSTQAINIKSLMGLLLSSENTISIENLSEKQVFTTVVLKDVRWTHTESIDEWGESPDKFDSVPIKGPDGQQLYAPHPLTGQPTAQTKMVPKRAKLETGQPFMQDVIGSEEAIQTATMKIMLGHLNEDFDLKQRVRVEFQNYRYGGSAIYMPGLKAITLDASMRGNIMDEDPTKNPFAAYNSAYRGLNLIVIANVSKVKDYTGADNMTRKYCTLIAGLVLYEKAQGLDPSDRILPEMPENFPADVISGADLKEVTMAIDPAKGKEAAKVVVAPPVRGVQAGPIVVDEVAVEKEEDDEDLTREDVLYEMSDKELKKILRQYRKEGHEVTLRGNTASFVNQILHLEKAVPAEQVMEAHEEAVEVAEAKAAEEVTEEKPKTDRSEAKAKLLAKKKVQVDATQELEATESGPAPDEIRELEEIIRDMIADVPGEQITWDDLGGDSNDMGIFPAWVTPTHRTLVETMIERIQKELSA